LRCLFLLVVVCRLLISLGVLISKGGFFVPFGAKIIYTYLLLLLLGVVVETSSFSLTHCCNLAGKVECLDLLPQLSSCHGSLGVVLVPIRGRVILIKLGRAFCRIAPASRYRFFRAGGLISGSGILANRLKLLLLLAKSGSFKLCLFFGL